MRRLYVIWNTTKRAYVGPPGAKSSFTRDIRKARVFESLQAAEADCCGDERVEGWTGLERFL